MSLSREQIQKFGDEIIAWADGKRIQYRSCTYNEWKSVGYPCWILDYEYRVKPEPEKPKFGYVNAVGKNFLIADTRKSFFDNTPGAALPFVTRTPEIDELLKNAGYELPEEGGDK